MRKRRLSSRALFMTYLSAGQMLAIECNPRLHSNITLMDTKRQQAAEAIYRAMETNNNNIYQAMETRGMNNNADKQTIAVPDPRQKHIIWTYNELAKLLQGEGEKSCKCYESYNMHPVSTDHCPGTCISTIVRPRQRDEDSAGVQGRCVGQLRPSALLPAPPPADPLPAGGQAGPGGGRPPLDHCQLLSWPAQMRQLED